MAGYPFTEIESRWQGYWAENKTFRASDDIDPSKPKHYVLDMFPYPSGKGLHVGHPEGYTASDVIARYKRMRGFNVLHPIGWDAFGLPAEQYALKTGTHPKITTEHNVNRFREQLKALGFSYDWDREINTTDPAYYRWTQWIFKQLFEQGLAYQEEMPVWWCPELGTTLANEEVIDGYSEVGRFACVRRPLRQWVLKITAFADELLSGLNELDWPESTKEMQRHWIGRSEGAEIEFLLSDSDQGGAKTATSTGTGTGTHDRSNGDRATLRVFSTRPDTLFGATYMVLAPEHTLVERITTPEQRSAVATYREQAARKSEFERTELQKEKTGVFTGAYAINPVNGRELPIWIADYVLAGYGTGAIMAVPAQDQRDWDFATAHELPVIRTVQPPTDFDGGPWLKDGEIINSDFLNGLHLEVAKTRMIDWLESNGKGRRHVNYKLRDWLFSRQRYWGEPFPIVFVDGAPEAVTDSALPVMLPELEEFKPSGSPEGPLATAEDWIHTTAPATGQSARRETNTMPQWAGSCWYYLRFIDPHNNEQLVDPAKEQYWMPVDLYVGGAEHAVLHLLYARFWHKVLYRAGVVSTPEPFKRLVHQGMILGELEYTAFIDADGKPVSAAEAGNSEARAAAGVTTRRLDANDVSKEGERFVLRDAPDILVEARAHKMSKSRGNVVNPDDILAAHGADAFRLYEMFMGPLEQVKPWSSTGVDGTHRFLDRVWRLFVDDKHPDDEARQDSHQLRIADSSKAPTIEQMRVLHRTISKVTDDIENLRFNTAIAALMELTNAAYKWDYIPAAIAEPFVLLLAPLAPHIAEELWHRLGHDESLAYAPWPEANPDYLRADTVEIPVQVNGKLRAKITIPVDADQAQVLALARADHNVCRHLEGVQIRREIYVPGRILNFVITH